MPDQASLPRCMICGTDHQPGGQCDDAGMDRQIERMGARRWNRITGAHQGLGLKALLADMRQRGQIK